MINKFEIEFKGTLAEFAGWASETFQNAEGLQLTIKIEMPVYTGPQSPLTRALAKMGLKPFPREVVDALEQYARKGEAIPAIKTIRTHTGMALKEAKDFLYANFEVAK